MEVQHPFLSDSGAVWGGQFDSCLLLSEMPNSLKLTNRQIDGPSSRLLLDSRKVSPPGYFSQRCSVGGIYSCRTHLPDAWAAQTPRRTEHPRGLPCGLLPHNMEVVRLLPWGASTPTSSLPANRAEAASPLMPHLGNPASLSTLLVKAVTSHPDSRAGTHCQEKCQGIWGPSSGAYKEETEEGLPCFLQNPVGESLRCNNKCRKKPEVKV